MNWKRHGWQKAGAVALSSSSLFIIVIVIVMIFGGISFLCFVYPPSSGGVEWQSIARSVGCLDWSF
jgi:hypothetical protein